MLVCNVSQRARRAVIAASISEIAAAVDATATGNIVFATLVDDPASVGDRVDAYLGEIMLEAANAAAIVNVSVVYAVAIVEEAAAAHTSSTFGTFTYSADISEAASAADLSSVSSGVYGVDVAETATAISTQAASSTTVVRRSALVGVAPVFVNPGNPLSSMLQSGTVVVATTTSGSDATAAETSVAESAQDAAVNNLPP
jgi:hypothetical protein